MVDKCKMENKKLLVTAMTIPLMLAAMMILSTISISSAYAQNVNTLNGITNLAVNGKNYPIKFNISTGKLLGLVEDKDRAALIATISAPHKGTLNIEVPKNILDGKGLTVHVDGKDATFRETSNTITARTLAVDFKKGSRLVEIMFTLNPPIPPPPPSGRTKDTS